MESANSLQNITNNFGAKDDDGLTCHFIHIEGGTCQDFDLNKCPIPGVDAPPVQESPAKSSVGRMAELITTTILGLALVLNIGF